MLKTLEPDRFYPDCFFSDEYLGVNIANLEPDVLKTVRNLQYLFLELKENEEFLFKIKVTPIVQIL